MSMNTASSNTTSSKNYLLGRLLARLLEEEYIIDSAEQHLRPDFHPVMMAAHIRDYCKRGEWHKTNSVTTTKQHQHALTTGRGLAQEQQGPSSVIDTISSLHCLWTPSLGLWATLQNGWPGIRMNEPPFSKNNGSPTD
jgi:hypothetical protein